MIQELHRLPRYGALYSLLRQELLSEALTVALGDYQWNLDRQRKEIVFSSGTGRVTGHAGADPAAARIRDVGARSGLDSLIQGEVPWGLQRDGDPSGAVVALTVTRDEAGRVTNMSMEIGDGWS